MNDVDERPRALAQVSLTTSAETASLYAALTADYNPIHLDPEFAAGTGFGQTIAHGTMALALVLEAVERTFGRGTAIDDLAIRFVRPVVIGATIHAGGHLRDGGEADYDIFVETDPGERTLEGTLRVRHARRQDDDQSPTRPTE